jgi:hypothetical protein
MMIVDPVQEPGQEDLFDERLERPDGKPSRRGTSGLTCHEASVDDILSEGESL